MTTPRATDTVEPVVNARLLVIGAGPHSLSLVLRLLEDSKADTLTVAEQDRLLFWNVRGPSHLKGRARLDEQGIIVVDPSGAWLSQWGKQFGALDIQHLRSPATVHPDPFDDDALRRFAFAHGRLDELMAPESFDRLKGINKSVSSIKRSQLSGFNEHNRSKYLLPSTRLFWDFCSDLVRSHHLQDIVVPASVLSVQHEGTSETHPYRFIVNLSNGSRIHAAAVVWAGNALQKRIPTWARSFYSIGPPRSPILLHSSDIIASFPCAGIGKHSDTPVEKSDKSHFFKAGSHVVIIGRGLTAGHLVINALRAGCKSVHMIVRRYLRVKQFDLAPEWMSAVRNRLRHVFLSSTFEERADVCRNARDGGSLTPEIKADMDQWLLTGRLVILQHTEVTHADFTNEDGAAGARLALSTGDNLRADVVVLATGAVPDATQDTVIKTLVDQSNVPIINGLPCVRENLQLTSGMDFFVMGAYSALRVGPDALNLLGGRTAASIIESDLQERHILVDNGYSQPSSAPSPRRHKQPHVLTAYCLDNRYLLLDEVSC